MCSAFDWPVFPATTVTVTIMDSYFDPDSVSITQGDTVKWINQGSLSHTSTSGTDGNPDGIWDSGTLAPGDSFKFAFQDTGIFPYYCSFHWFSGMTGKILVNPSTGVRETGKISSFSGFKLSQNYPNPFRDFTTINYYTPQNTNIRLVIHDASGKIVHTLLDKKHIPGNYYVVWDGKNSQGKKLPEGVYFSQMIVNNRILETRLLVLIN